MKPRGEQLVEVKAGEFVSEQTIAKLNGAFAIRAVKRLSPVLPVLSRKDTRVPFTTCAEMLRHDAGRNTPLWKLAVEYEMARGGLTEAEVIAKMVDIVRILRRSIAQGIAGTHYDDRVLGHQCGQFNELMKAGRLLDGGALNRIILYVTALMEVKSSMGVIVAAPTAGACAALPGAVIAMAEAMGLGEEEMAKAMLASGLIGVFIATRWTFAAEVGGCQAEGGSAASMAAAALVDTGRRHAGAIRRGRFDGVSEHAGTDLRSDGQPRRSALPRQERDGRQQRAGLREHGAGRLRSRSFRSTKSSRRPSASPARCRASCAARRWAGCRSRRPRRPLSSGWRRRKRLPAAAGAPATDDECQFIQRRPVSQASTDHSNTNQTENQTAL